MDPARASALRLRVVSALVMAPVALAAVWFGWPWLPALVLAAVALMGWEWARLCERSAAGPARFPAIVTAVLTGVGAVLAASLGRSGAGILIALAGAALLAVGWRRRAAEPLWLAAGTLWISVPCVAFVWLAAAPAAGRGTVLWLLALVWATDIGAYFAGRAIGGPRLAPRWSPNKTWAGFAGGLLSAGLVGLAAARLAHAVPALVVPASLGLAVVAQLGDLAESLAKRHFGVKDSSGLIPGHGGLLDRLDGLLTAAAAQGASMLLFGAGPLTLS